MAGTTRRRPEDERPSPLWLFISMLAILVLFVAAGVAIATSSRPAHAVPQEPAPGGSPAPGETYAPEPTHEGIVVRFPAA